MSIQLSLTENEMTVYSPKTGNYTTTYSIFHNVQVCIRHLFKKSSSTHCALHKFALDFFFFMICSSKRIHESSSSCMRKKSRFSRVVACSLRQITLTTSRNPKTNECRKKYQSLNSKRCYGR